MKLALAQTNICWEDKQANEAAAEQLIMQASASHAHIIFFPEMCLTGFSMNISAMGEERLGYTIGFFAALAKRFNICVGFGYIEMPSNVGKGKNNYAVVDGTGNLLNIYSKIHPFSNGREAEFYEGGIGVEAYKLNEWCISSFICYDLRFPEVFQIASKKSQLITVAANWPESRIRHWETLLQARAIENQSYIAGINRAGYGDNIKYSGSSMVIDPLGNIIAKGGASEELILCEIDMKNVYNIRRNFKLKDDRREALYASYYKIGDD